VTGPRHIVVMGVSGTGKTTVGEELARRLDVTFIEGDSLHPRSNIAKMSAGHPLDDDDRRPWLETLNRLLTFHHAEGVSTVLTCSALRRAYRDTLRHGLPDGSVFFLHLAAPAEVLQTRMERREHFMPASLLVSQLDTLEPLGHDEAGAVVDVTGPVAEVVEEALRVTGRFCPERGGEGGVTGRSGRT
jgi:gluconokinase